jgi:hypothetical protein
MALATFFKTALLSGAALVAITPAFAPDTALAHEPRPSVILNGQVNFSDVQGLTVVDAHSSHNAAAASVAAGNMLNARVTQGTGELNSTQTMSANTLAYNQVGIEHAGGTTTSVAQASGNAGQVEVCCGAVLGDAAQTTTQGTNAVAISDVAVRYSDIVASSAAASGNAWGISGTNAYIDVGVTQTNNANVYARSRIDGHANSHALSSAATAVANSNRIASESATVYSGVLQTNTAAATADSMIYQGHGTNVTSGASAGGNVAAIDNKWGYAQMDGYQENSGPITARSEVHIGDWAGFAASGANAIGNTAMVSNLGSDATLGMVQNNFSSGGVSAYATLQGNSSSGGVGVVNASATGNAATVYSCASCGDGAVKVEGYVSQYNYAPVTATAVAGVGSTGAITATASAVGNSASFIVGSPRGH